MTPRGLRTITPFSQRGGEWTEMFNPTELSQKPIRRKPRSMTPSMKLHLNGFMSCLLGHSKPTFAAIHLYSVFSQTGEYWGVIEGTQHQVSSGEKDLIRDLQTRGCWPGWSYLPAPDLGINFVLGDTGCYGWKSLVHLAA